MSKQRLKLLSVCIAGLLIGAMSAIGGQKDADAEPCDGQNLRSGAKPKAGGGAVPGEGGGGIQTSDTTEGDGGGGVKGADKKNSAVPREE